MTDNATSHRAAILDGYCGAGGCGAGYYQAGFDPEGIDIASQPNYPYRFHQGDFLSLDPAWIARNFDAVHASPPCQAYSQMHGSTGPDLIGETRDLLLATGLPFVIENVVGAPLENPIMLCGSSFGLDVERHRLFECHGFSAMALPCAHHLQKPRFEVQNHGRRYLSGVVPVYGTGGGKSAEHWPRAMGISWMTRAELAQAVPPAYTQHIGSYLFDAVEVAA